MTADINEVKQDIAELKISMEEAFERVEKRLGLIEQRLFFGNGTKPLTTKVELLDGKVTGLLSSWNGLVKFLLTICTALILSMGAFLWAVIVHAVTISTTVKVP